MSSSTEVINTSQVPRDLSTGRVLAPGERAAVVITDHERGLIATGGLTVVTPDTAEVVTNDTAEKPAAVEKQKGIR